MPVRLAIVVSIVVLLALAYSHFDDPWKRKFALETPERMNALAIEPNTLANWPPEVGKALPALKFYRHDGSAFDLNSLRGKPLLVEMISMTCAGCQAFSGGSTHGGFGGFPVQSGLQSIERYYEQYSGGRHLFSEDLNFVQLLVYNLELQPATIADAAAWREHFKLVESNTFVLVSEPSLANGVTFKMIPGFLMLNKDLVVVFDSTGHNPKHNLFEQLLPGIRTLVVEASFQQR
jgi:hypothetical protein